MKRALVIHPFLFAIAPILFLYSQNADGFPLNVIYMPIVFALSLVVVCWLLLGLILRDRTKSAILVSLGIFTFVSFGYVYSSLCALFTDGYPSPTLQKTLLFVWPILFLVAAFFCLRPRRNQVSLRRFFNVAGLSLVIVPLISIIAFHLGAGRPIIGRGVDNVQALQRNVEDDVILPDIYYIILDGCARADVLAELYDYDNSAFLDHLRDKGFYIADRSCANYCQTVLSFASSLNFRYLAMTTNGLDPGSSSLAPLRQMILKSEVVHILRVHGYRTIAFATGYYPAEMVTADLFIKPERNAWHLDEFQNGLLSATAYPALIKVLERLPRVGKLLVDLEYGAHKGMILHTFDWLARPAGEGPRFIFAHIIAPHPPFVFGREGEAVDFSDFAGTFTFADGNHLHFSHPATTKQYVAKYRDQLIFIEKKILGTLDAILANATVPPIILLQADHGPGSGLDWEDVERTDIRERMGILNAYYLPERGDTLLYNEISPVNTFRLIFNMSFGGQFKFLGDRSYFSPLERPYDFIDVTDRIKAAELKTFMNEADVPVVKVPQEDL